MKKIIIAVLFVFGLVACSKPAPTPDPALLAAQTEIASAKDDISQLQLQLGEKDATLVYVVGQYHWLQSATPVTVIKEITPTFTATPKFTPTITNTPAPTNTPSPTVDPLKKAKGDGFYLIGVDIAPGVGDQTAKGIVVIGLLLDLMAILLTIISVWLVALLTYPLMASRCYSKNVESGRLCKIRKNCLSSKYCKTPENGMFLV